MIDEPQVQQEVPQEQEEPQSQETTPEPIDFLSSLPEELREDSSMRDIKDITGMAKSYISSQRMLGNSIRIPTKDSSSDDVDKFHTKLRDISDIGIIQKDNKENMDNLYEKLGRPKTPEEYRISEELGVKNGAEMYSSFSKKAHELGLSNDQYNKIIEFDTSRIKLINEKKAEAYANGTKELQKHWGGSYDSRIQGAKNALNKYKDKFSKESVQDIIKSNNPLVINILSEINSLTAEKGVQNLQGKVSYGMTPAEAQDKISEIQRNKEHAYHHYNHPNHKRAVEDFHKYVRLAYPD